MIMGRRLRGKSEECVLGRDRERVLVCMCVHVCACVCAYL